jgi:replicative DNA helicase
VVWEGRSREAFPYPDFSIEKHKRIFLRMGELHAIGDRINRVTLVQALASHRQLQSVDGLSYLATLDDGLPSLANIESFCRVVRNKATLRRAIVAAQAVIERCLGEADDPEDVLADAERLWRLAIWANEQVRRRQKISLDFFKKML